LTKSDYWFYYTSSSKKDSSSSICYLAFRNSYSLAEKLLFDGVDWGITGSLSIFDGVGFGCFAVEIRTGAGIDLSIFGIVGGAFGFITSFIGSSNATLLAGSASIFSTIF
jgi:hypothetical protein